MLKHTIGCIKCLIVLGLLPLSLQAQVNTMPKPRVTVFIPLNLDSTVVNGRPIYSNAIPGHIMNSLDFFNGMQIAATELEEQGVSARIRVIDSESPTAFEQFFRDTVFEGNGIVIAAAQNSASLKVIADQMKPVGVPLITILPSDAGITGYPQMMMPNSSLKVHCEQLHRFLIKYHSIDNLIMLKMNGNAETRLHQFLQEANSNTKTVPLEWSEIDFSENFNETSILQKLDSNRLNVIIAPTLNAANAQNIVKLLSSQNAKYRTAVFGMPTWETVNFGKKEFKGVDIWYGTPFLTSSGNALLNEVFIKKYRNLTNSKPGDMAYRGYELVFRYVRTLSQYGPDFLKHINDYKFKLFNDFDFEPVSLRNNGQTDYLENQKIYFIKKTDGVVKTVLAP